MRFRTEQHLRRQADIRAVREEGRRVDCRAFTLWWKKQPAEAAGTGAEDRPVRVCVIASTKAVGVAVQRNRAKRRLREMFRLQQNCAPQGHDFLLIARSAATSTPMPELEKRFVDACRQIGSATAAAEKR